MSQDSSAARVVDDAEALEAKTAEAHEEMLRASIRSLAGRVGDLDQRFQSFADDVLKEMRGFAGIMRDIAAELRSVASRLEALEKGQ